MNRAALLDQAMDLVGDVYDDLDTSVSQCDCCGREEWNHYGERKVAIQLEAIINKLDKLIPTIDRLNPTKQG